MNASVSRFFEKAMTCASPALPIVFLSILAAHATHANPRFLDNLEVDGSLTVKEDRETVDGVVFHGTFDGLSTLPVAGSGTRFLWYPRKAALRSGRVTGTQWDDAFIGDYSIAMGFNPVAGGQSSIALGERTHAHSVGSAALGYRTSAIGIGAFAAGSESEADGDGAFAAGTGAFALGAGSVSLGDSNAIFGNAENFAAGSSNLIDESDRSIALGYDNFIDFGTAAIAIGKGNFVTGNASIAFGRNLSNSVYSSLVIGQFNEPVAGSETAWEPSDPLFVIGSGTDEHDRRNAWVVRKSGDTEMYGDLYVGENATVAGDLVVEGSLLADFSLPDDLSVAGNLGIGVPPDPVHALDVSGSVRSEGGFNVASGTVVDTAGNLHVPAVGVGDDGHLDFNALNDSLMSAYGGRVTLHHNRADDADKGFGIRSHSNRSSYRWDAYFGSGGNFIRGDLEVEGGLDARGGLTSHSEIKARGGFSAQFDDAGNLVTVFAANNQGADEAGTGVRVALSNSPAGSDGTVDGATMDAIRQPDGSNDLVFSSAGEGDLNEIVRLRGASRSAVIDGDAEINGNLTIAGETTIAHVPPQGGIMMGEFGSSD